MKSDWEPLKEPEQLSESSQAFWNDTGNLVYQSQGP